MSEEATALEGRAVPSTRHPVEPVAVVVGPMRAPWPGEVPARGEVAFSDTRLLLREETGESEAELDSAVREAVLGLVERGAARGHDAAAWSDGQCRRIVVVELGGAHIRDGIAVAAEARIERTASEQADE